MPMSKKNTKEEIIQNKKLSMRLLNNLLEGYIADDTKLRKADLLCKWIKDYVAFIGFEEKFDPCKNISYRRGDIVKVNFGFNIGAELGGVHYAVVIDNKNDRASNTVTVIPMSSIKDNSNISRFDLNIGSEFYNTMAAKYDSLLKEMCSHRDELIEIFKEIKYYVGGSFDNNIVQEENPDQIPVTDSSFTKLNDKIRLLNKDITILEKNRYEIGMMKGGSIIKPKQIRTISKMRIWIPKTPKDPLYGVKLSDSTMDKLNEKIKEFFIR